MRQVALSIGSLILALVLVEIMARALAPDVPLLRGELTVPGEHAVRTGEYAVTVHVNREGFVDREWGERAHVVVIGDSFVQAAQVALDEGYGRRLDAELAALGLAEAEVLSMGVPGAGTATALGVLERYALPRRPRVVILGFLLSNDVLNNHPLLDAKDDKPFYTLRDGALVRTDAHVEAMPRARWSHALRFIGRTWAEREATRRKIELGGGIPIDLRVHDPDGGPVWEEAWAVTEALIAEMARRCAEDGVRFGTVLFPDAAQASPDGWTAATKAWPEARGWDPARAGDRALAMARRHGAALDLRGAIPGDAYFPRDGHWNPAGHAAAARGSAELVAGLLRE